MLRSGTNPIPHVHVGCTSVVEENYFHSCVRQGTIADRSCWQHQVEFSESPMGDVMEPARRRLGVQYSRGVGLGSEDLISLHEAEFVSVVGQGHGASRGDLGFLCI